MFVFDVSDDEVLMQLNESVVAWLYDIQCFRQNVSKLALAHDVSVDQDVTEDRQVGLEVYPRQIQEPLKFFGIFRGTDDESHQCPRAGPENRIATFGKSIEVVVCETSL